MTHPGAPLPRPIPLSACICRPASSHALSGRHAHGHCQEPRESSALRRPLHTPARQQHTAHMRNALKEPFPSLHPGHLLILLPALQPVPSLQFMAVQSDNRRNPTQWSIMSCKCSQLGELKTHDSQQCHCWLCLHANSAQQTLHSIAGFYIRFPHNHCAGCLVGNSAVRMHANPAAVRFLFNTASESAAPKLGMHCSGWHSA